MTIRRPDAGRKPKDKHRPIGKKLKNTKKKVKSKSGGKNPNFVPLGSNPRLDEKMKAVKGKKKEKKEKGSEGNDEGFLVSTASAAQQLRFFLHHYQSANKFKLSPLELEAFKDTCMVELSYSIDQDVDNFSTHIKAAFGTSWEDVLCDGKLLEGKVDPGCPAVIVISSAALRSLELLRGLRPLTNECRPAKLFAKHMKVEEQVALLKGRVNIASGTPSRIKKLIDMEALLLSRLEVIVLDMQRDAKGYSLFTLPQVSAEFWDLYKTHFNERLVEGRTKIIFYGPVLSSEYKKICQVDSASN